MKRVTIALLLLGSLFFMKAANEIEELKPISARWPIKMGGYIKNESFWDTRQVEGAREDQTLLYPKKIELDANCNDLNSQGQWTMVALQTRMRWEIDGPKVKNANSSGTIEYDFFGRAGIGNIFRMRHAYMMLTWEKVQMLMGQAYHPLYVIGVDPRTISFNTGIPLDTFSRNPQFRIAYKPEKHFELTFCGSAELDFPTDGPIGKSTTYLRDSVTPMLDFRLDTYWGEHRAGLGIDYKRIRPRLKTDTGLKTNETLNSAIAIAYTKLKWDSFNTRFKFIFYQNATDQNMIGGYAVKTVDPDSDKREYANLNGIAFWNDTDITYSKSIIPGWFIGIAKNLGARTTILQNVIDTGGNITDRRIYGDGTDLNYLFRVAPRILWKINNFTFAAEVEYTRAAYGTINCDGEVIDTDPVGVTRVLASVFYHF